MLLRLTLQGPQLRQCLGQLRPAGEMTVGKPAQFVALQPVHGVGALLYNPHGCSIAAGARRIDSIAPYAPCGLPVSIACSTRSEAPTSVPASGLSGGA
jgi:hypothetical protein